jgi:hypothetical protein
LGPRRASGQGEQGENRDQPRRADQQKAQIQVQAKKRQETGLTHDLSKEKLFCNPAAAA